MKYDYRSLTKLSTVVISWGIFLWIAQTIVFLITYGWHWSSFNELEEFVKGVSLVIIVFSVLIHYMAKNDKLMKGHLIKVWVATEKFSKIDGQHGRWFEFPAHAIPNIKEKIRVEHPDLKTGNALLRITDKEHIFIDNKLVAIKLFCLV